MLSTVLTRLRLTLLLAVCLTLGACTTNPLALKVLYGQFDNFMARELLAYADFDQAQKTLIRAEVDRTVAWHRDVELPLYAELMSEFEQRLVQQPPTPDDIDWFFAEVSELGKRFDQNSPLTALAPILQTLDDQQIEQIAERTREELAEERAELEEEADQDPAILAARNLTKAVRRVGLKLSAEQRENARQHFAQRRLSRLQQHAIWEQWGDELIDILRVRKSDDFVRRFRDHYSARLRLIETRLPQDWAHDREIYTQMTLELFQSLDQKQRASISRRFASLIDTARDLAGDGQLTTLNSNSLLSQ